MKKIPTFDRWREMVEEDETIDEILNDPEIDEGFKDWWRKLKGKFKGKKR